MKKKIIAPNKNEKIREKNEKLTDKELTNRDLTDREEKNGEKDAGFLPIFFWTD